MGQQANVSAKGEGGAADSGPSTGAEGGEAYRDPFDPDFWTQQVQTAQGKPGEQTTTPTTVEDPDPNDAEQEVALVVPGQKPEQMAAPQDETGKTDKTMSETGDASETDATEEAMKARERAAEILKSEIEKEIGGAAGKLAEGLIVAPAEGGLLVTISDQSDAPMFNIGSAVPRKELVVAMERIGKLLSQREGPIVIRGHTDGRQFKGTENDNWRLSMARAHSAYYMLVRGGLSESRVEQVSGFADRRLQVPDDPLADANRRIEILIQADQG